jgi:multidrug efflux system membrane fusion protein
MRTADIACAAALALFCGACQKTEIPPKVLTPVKAAAVRAADTSGEIRYSANILPQTRVDVAFRVGGYIAGLHQRDGRALQEGDFVRKGTVLARVRQDDYDVKVRLAKSTLAEAAASLAATKSQAAEAEASLRQAEIDFGRAASLFESQSLTKADYDSAATKLEISKARVAGARNQAAAIERRMAAADDQVREAEIALGDTELKAPIDGTVLSRPVEVGSLAGPGTLGVVLGDTGSVKAVFGVPDAVVARLRLGQTLAIRTDSIPGADFPGRITRIAPAADARSRLFEVELFVSNRANQLRPGMIATVTLFDSGPRQRVPVLPLTAIVPSKTEHQYAVFVLEPNGAGHVARMRNVRLGEAVGSAIAVLDGVKLGQLVVTNGSNLVADGEPVQLVP